MGDKPQRAWDLPEPISIHEVRVDSETTVFLRRHGNTSGPRLVLSHGNGLAIDLYLPYWSLLADKFDLFVYDLRNHGWNDVTAQENHNVPRLVADHDAILDAIDREYGDKTQAGVFHSLSALVSLLSPKRGERFCGLLLFDPPLCKPGRNYQEFEEAAVRAAGFARRRTDRFASREKFSDALPFLPPFQRFVSGAHELMAETTLRESKDAGYALRCPREYEAQIVDYAGVFGVAVDFETLKCPVKVIGADPTVPFSYLPSLDMSDIMSVNYDFLPDATHFLQLEQPERCAAATFEFLESVGMS